MLVVGILFVYPANVNSLLSQFKLLEIEQCTRVPVLMEYALQREVGRE